MPTYLERYRAGEHEAVWRELQALGPAVRAEPVYADAVAVAQETMRRVRANIVTLIERLRHLGYRFHCEERDDEPFAPLLPPLSDIAEQLRDVEARYGPLPISLRAFYETVGGVYFDGYFTFSPEFEARYNLDELLQEIGGVPEWLDPLEVFAFHEDIVIDPAKPELAEWYEDIEYVTVWISGVPDLGQFEVTLPCETMDGNLWIEEEHPEYHSHETTGFVNVLRRAFSWGGFNKLSWEFNPVTGNEEDGRGRAIFLRTLHTVSGESYLDYLTRDLLPI